MQYQIIFSKKMTEITDYLIDKLAEIFNLFFQLTGDYGISLFLLSISCSIIIYGLNSFFKRYQIKEIEIQKIINPQLELIKNEKEKEKKHLRIKALYKRYSYNPIYGFRLLIPFLIQLPFLFSAYFMLLNFDALEGVSFGIIEDLSSQDGLIYGINILPFLMTLVFVLLAKTSLGISQKEKKQSYIISLFFLLLLYKSPSALIVFWTINSLILFILNNYLDENRNYKFFIKIKKFVIANFIVRFSILLLILPFLINNCSDNYFLKYLLFPSILIIFIFDYFIKSLNKKIKLILLTFITFFFYSLIFYTDTLHLYHSLRFRYFSLIFIVFLIVVFHLISKLKKERFLNVFLIVFSILGIITLNKSSHNNIKELRSSLELTSKKLRFQNSPIKNNTPLVLIIVDELAPSNQVINYTSSDKDNEFDKFLIKNGYYVKNQIKSHSKKTKISISSMLNFNLVNSKWIKDYEVRKEYASTNENFNSLIKNNLLVESLYNKGINSYSFGKVSFSLGIKNENNFYYLWENIGFTKIKILFKDIKFLKSFFSKSILNFIDTKLNYKTSHLDSDRKQIFDNLRSVSLQKNSFYMFHLDAPHPPFSYFNEFSHLDVEPGGANYINGYISYRRFILRKLMFILSDDKFINSRIIVIGDHGLRSSKGFDPYLTFGAFYGFDNKDIIKLNEVQDVGSLIEKYLN